MPTTFQHIGILFLGKLFVPLNIVWQVLSLAGIGSLRRRKAILPRSNLDNLPILVLQRIIDHLDIGHVISLAQCNRLLRRTLINDNGLWTILLHTRLRAPIPRRFINDTFTHVMRLARTGRCSSCFRMELRKHNHMDLFWSRTLCDQCKFRNDNRKITAFTAKQNYGLTDDDLLDLKTETGNNPHAGQMGPYTRRFSRIAVQRRRDEKAKESNITESQRLANKATRSARARRSRRQYENRRLREIRDTLAARGFPNANRHMCAAVDGYRRNCDCFLPGPKRKWSLQEAVDVCMRTQRAVGNH
jgi:hypothetical protein